MLDQWQAITTGLSKKFMYCSSHHFIKLNNEGEIFKVSNVFWEVMFTEFDRITAKPKFKSVVSWEQDVELIIDPTDSYIN